MANVTKVKVKFSSDLSPDKILDDATAKLVGETVKDMMLNLISKGISPVRGEGKFKAYAEQRLNDKTKYPKSVKKKFPGKKTRPVNLSLSGELLKKFGWWISKGARGLGKTTWIGFKNPSKRTKDLLETHNEGRHKDVPKRQILPDFSQNEELAVSINRKIVEIYRKRVESIINKANSK